MCDKDTVKLDGANEITNTHADNNFVCLFISFSVLLLCALTFLGSTVLQQCQRASFHQFHGGYKYHVRNTRSRFLILRLMRMDKRCVCLCACI